jgi:hypothetical protein
MAVKYTTRYGVPFKVALKHYKRCRAAIEACPAEKEDKLWELVQIGDLAIDVLVSTPAPDLAALVIKMRTVNNHFREIGSDLIDSGVADAIADELAALVS